MARRAFNRNHIAAGNFQLYDSGSDSDSDNDSHNHNRAGASGLSTASTANGGASVWVFGYGSLCWNPGFEFSKCVTGYIRGYVRRFWQGNDSHRGTKEKVSARFRFERSRPIERDGERWSCVGDMWVWFAKCLHVFLCLVFAYRLIYCIALFVDGFYQMRADALSLKNIIWIASPYAVDTCTYFGINDWTI